MTVFRSDTSRTFSHNASHNARGIERVNEEWENKYFFEQTAQGASLACYITFIIFLLKILVKHVFD